MEKALEWDPDVIVVQGGNDLNELYAAEQIQEMKAIKNKQVFSCPIAGFWWDRPSPEATLGFLWLAQTVYPDYMQDIDLEAETKAFFKEFYGYELSDEECRRSSSRRVVPQRGARPCRWPRSFFGRAGHAAAPRFTRCGAVRNAVARR